MVRKLHLYIILGFILILSTGCSTIGTTYSFNDPNIEAYVNGQPVYTLQKQQYIDFKKLLTQAIASLHDTEGANNQNNLSEEDALSCMAREIEYQKAEQLLNYNEQDWDTEYYKSYIVDSALSDLLKNNTELNSVFQNLVESSLDSFKTTKIIFTANTEIDATIIINTLEKKYDLSDQEFTETIYKPFLQKESANEFLFENIANKIYKGKVVKYDGTNISDYKPYWEDINKQYDQYINDLFSKSNVVTRNSSPVKQ